MDFRPNKKKFMFPVSDRPYSEPPTLTFFFTLEKKYLKKTKKRRDKKNIVYLLCIEKNKQKELVVGIAEIF